MQQAIVLFLYRSHFPLYYIMRILLVLLLNTLLTVSLFAQKQLDEYAKAVDEINCKTTKMLLASYNRSVAARSIMSCNYDDIKAGIDKVQENKLKGYKEKIAQLSSDIEGYKSKVSNTRQYDSFSNALDDLNNMVLGRCRKMCEADQALAPEVCPKLDEKMLGLQADLDDVAAKALNKIKRATSGGGNDDSERNTAPAAPQPAAKHEATATPTTDDSAANGSSSGFTTTLIFLMIIALAAVCGWLYKEMSDLKEQVEDLKTLVNILNKQRN